MGRFFISLFVALFIVGIWIPQASSATTLSINSVRIGTHPDKTRIVIELSEKIQFRAFALQNPPRIVVDAPDFNWNAGTPDLGKNSAISNIRHGLLQPEISRIVMELKQNVTIKSAFMLPAVASVPDRLVIDFTTAASGANANAPVFGTLSSPPPTFGSQLASPEIKPVTTSAAPPAHETPSPPRSGKKSVVVIDPGHGGGDPGALGANGRKEKEVTLAVAKELKSQLEATDRYTVHLTRSTDIFIKLQDRVKIARKHNADLFISLHADSIDKPNVSGASIYTLSNKASDAQTAKLAARENQADLIAGVDLSHEDKEVANILIDLAMRDTMNQSKFFANTVVKKASSKGIDLLDKPHRFAGFAVLKAPDIPSVLVEMGFMSNRAEVSKLSSPDYRKKIAGALANGVDAYFAKIHKNGQN